MKWPSICHSKGASLQVQEDMSMFLPQAYILPKTMGGSPWDPCSHKDVQFNPGLLLSVQAVRTQQPLPQQCQFGPVKCVPENTWVLEQSSCVLVTFNCAVSQPPPTPTHSCTTLFHQLQRQFNMLEICVGTEKRIGNWSRPSLHLTGFGTYIKDFRNTYLIF